MAKTQSFWSQDVGKNLLINGNFDLWARGTSFVYTDAYSADRWGTHQYQVAVRTRQSFVAGGEHPGNSEYVLRCAGNGVGSARLQVAQGIEKLNTIPLRGRVVTLSFYARFSATTTTANLGTFYSNLGARTSSADAVFYTNNYLETNSQTVISQGSLPTTWKKYTLSYTVPANANNVAIVFGFSFDPVVTSSDWYEISQVKLEVGASATPFSLAGGSIGNEILLAQRYYEKSYNQATNPGTATLAGALEANNLKTGPAGVFFNVQYKVVKRTTPTSLIIYSTNSGATGNLYDRDGAVDVVAVTTSGSDSGFNITNNASFGGVDRRCAVHWAADSEL